VFREQAQKLGLSDYEFSKLLIQVGTASYIIMEQIKEIVRKQQKERLKLQKKHSPILRL
jgi:hypothetical protein